MRVKKALWLTDDNSDLTKMYKNTFCAKKAKV